MTSTTLRLNPALQAWPFDGAAREPMVMCELPRTDGSVARFVVPERLYELLRHFDGRPTEAVLRSCEGAPGDFGRMVENVLVPRGFLLPEGADASAAAPAASRLGYMTMRVPLLRPWMVTPVARALGWLFHPAMLVAGGVAIVAAHLLFYLHLAPAHELGFRTLQGSHAGAVVVVMILSTLFHEFGHAAAAARYGCRDLEIGWGLYYHMQVLYTNLSEAWRLPRGQRALVDLAGMYFQGLLAVLMLGWYQATGSLVPLYAFVATDLAIISSLNPFFRMDGYWLLSDLLGVPNLQSQSMALVRRGVFRAFGRDVAGIPAPPFGRGGLALLAVYGALGMLLMVMAVKLVVRILVVGVLVAYPQVLAAFWAALTAPSLSAVTLASTAFSVFWRGLVLFGTARLAYNLGVRVFRGGASLAGVLRDARRREAAVA